MNSIHSIDADAAALHDLVRLRQESEDAARESRATLQAAFASMAEAVFIADAEGRLIDFSEEFVRYHRFQDREQCSRTIADCPTYLEVWCADGTPAPLEQWALPRALRGETASNVEYRLRSRITGETWWGSYNFAPIRDQQGRITGAVVAGREITEQKRAEAALRESEARLRAVLDSNPDPIFLKDREGRLLLANPATFAVIGKPAEACLGRTDEEYCDNPADGRALMANDRAVMASGRAEIVEEVVRTPSGLHYFVSHKAPYRDAAGDVVGLVGTGRDITERKLAELALLHSRQQLSLALEAGQLGFWDWDLTSGRVHYGGRWAAMLGYDPDEIEPRLDTWERLVHPDDRASVMDTLSGHLEGRTDFYESTHRMRHKDGSWRWILDRGQVVERDAQGRPLRATGTHADVTARREAELALREADRRKDEFLATLAHELRNPLAPIRNSIQALRLTLDRHPTAEPLLAMMERQMTHLVRLVDDLLEISRITRGQIELRKERVDLGTIVGQAVETSRPLIDGGRHRLEIALPAGPLVIEADPVRLTQVLANLLNNAAKYTEPGGTIRVTAARQGDAAVVSVRDSGLGIAPELLPQVFDLFIQSGRNLARAQGGLGIGLALVRRLVEMHGGTVTAHSAGPGRGSEFVVRLPAPPAPDPAPAARAERPDPTAAVRILVVDDNRDGADSLAQLLALLGHETRSAYDGEQGVLEAERLRPDVILLDLGMPKLDGHAACRRIRERPWGAAVVIVALTGWGQAEDRRRTREAGFDGHLAKPVDCSVLTRLINDLLAAKHPPTTAP